MTSDVKHRYEPLVLNVKDCMLTPIAATETPTHTTGLAPAATTTTLPHTQKTTETAVLQTSAMADVTAMEVRSSFLTPFFQPQEPNSYPAGQSVELEPLAQNGQQFGRAQDPNAILNECRAIDHGIDDIERKLESLKMLQQRALDDPDTSATSSTNRQLDDLSAEIMTGYRGLLQRIKTLKAMPESGSPKNAPQLGKVDRRLKATVNMHQNVESTFRKRTQEQMARQYKIVRPEASDEEVREAVEDTRSQQIFSQAMLQSDRRGQATSALNAVEGRHQAIQKIERQIIELAQLFQDMEELVVAQEDMVVDIEQKGEDVAEHMDKGTQEIGTAIKTARSRNKKKWICLGIAVTIIIVIVIIVVIIEVVNKSPNNTAKRSVSEEVELAMRSIPASQYGGGAEVNAMFARLVRAAREGKGLEN